MRDRHRGARFCGRVLATATLLVPVVPAHAAGHGDEPLRNAIRLFEFRPDRPHDRSTIALAFGDIPQDLDINSLVRIEIDASQLTASDTRARGPVDPEVERLASLVEELNRLLGPMTQAFDQARKLTELAAEGRRESSEFEGLALETRSMRDSFLRAAVSYRDWLRNSDDPGLRDRAAPFDAQVGAGLLRSGELMALSEAGVAAAAPLAAVVRDEVVWVNSELERVGAQIRDRLESVALVLVARAFTEGPEPSRIHVEHYDPLPPSPLVPYEKINWAGDSAEARRMLEAVRPILDTLRDLEAERIELGQAVEKLLEANGIDVDAFIESVDRLAGKLGTLRDADWEAEGRALLDTIRETLEDETLDEAQKETLRRMRERARTLERKLGGARDSLKDLEQGLSSLSLDRLLERAQSETHPVDALIALLDAIDDTAGQVSAWADAIEGLEGDVGAIKSGIDEVAELITRLGEDLDELSAGVREVLARKLQEFRDAELGDVAVAAGEMIDEGRKLVASLRELGADEQAQLLLYATGEFPLPEDIYYVLGTRVKDTFVDLRTVRGRREGTAVTLEARLFRVRAAAPDGSADNEASVGTARIGEELDVEKQVFVVRRFGWYSSPNVGVAYAGAVDELEGQSEATRQFTAQMSWLFRFRPWIENDGHGRPALMRQRFWHDIGYGLHVAPLDLDRDNQQEIGFGATLSFLEDFVQLGYGVNLSLSEEPYGFVGVRLFEFGKSLGVQSVPQTGTPGPD